MVNVGLRRTGYVNDSSSSKARRHSPLVLFEKRQASNNPNTAAGYTPLDWRAVVKVTTSMVTGRPNRRTKATTRVPSAKYAWTVSYPGE